MIYYPCYAPCCNSLQELLSASQYPTLPGPPVTTITVEPVPDKPAILMSWEHNVTAQDIRNAFQQINILLNTSATPQYVIVDLLNNPRLPIMETVVSALSGPFRNRRLIEWLVIGSNSTGRSIDDMLSRVTGRSNVRWFDSHDEVAVYLDGND